MLATALAVFRLAWQSVRRRPLSSILTALVVALGVALVVAVETVRVSADRSFTETARGYDVILGPPQGSPLQIVLSTLFHVDEPPGTLPWSAYEGIRGDPRVAAAIPYAMGDTYRGHRVVGTSPAMFEVLSDGEGRALAAGMRGRVFGDERFEAVVGSAVASRTGMGIGTTFGVSHGLVEGGQSHAERWSVVGVLRPTGTAHDRAIYIPIQTFYAIPGHTVPGQEAKKRPLSAVGVRLKSPALRLLVLQEYRTETAAAQAVLPADQVRKLMSIVGDVNRGVTLVAWIVTIVAAVSILVGLYNTIQGRRREIAVLRALGARPAHVFGLILLEALILCLLGGALGLLLGHGGVAAAAPTLLESYGVNVRVGASAYDLQVFGALVVLGLLAGLLPAWRGLTTPVADNLQSEA
jgi:putative ABC transport system permease protein